MISKINRIKLLHQILLTSLHLKKRMKTLLMLISLIRIPVIILIITIVQHQQLILEALTILRMFLENHLFHQLQINNCLILMFRVLTILLNQMKQQTQAFLIKLTKRKLKSKTICHNKIISRLKIPLNSNSSSNKSSNNNNNH